MKIQKAKAVKLLIAAGFKADKIKEMPAKRLTTKILTLKEKKPDIKGSSESLYEKLMKAFEADEKVSVVDGDEPAPDTSHKGNGKTKDKPDKNKGPSDGRPGVVAHIVTVLKKAKAKTALSKVEITDALCEKFPDRAKNGGREKLFKTTQNQTSYFLKKNGHNLKSVDVDGVKKYYIASAD